MPNVGYIKGILSNQEAYTETESPMRTGQDLQPCTPTYLQNRYNYSMHTSTLNNSQLSKAEAKGSLWIPNLLPSTDIVHIQRHRNPLGSWVLI